jgi:hypothetical protein
MADDTILCQTGNITVVRYRSMIRQRQKGVLVKFIHDRFSERYITPLRAIPKSPKNLRNGFCTMAICCLMVEALESFWEGLATTRAPGASRAAFVSFFNRSDNLRPFRPYADEFYTHVRCGILHQAETTGAWKIRRDGPLFLPKTLTINATRFHDELHKCLVTYCSALERERFDGPLWTAFNNKMKAICRNC